ncbi:IMPDH1 [Bugula neritina]|uniref:IMPDH1 n=1 Tax=Bugula neritina TaxID=10212 RepID=A0A7J7KAT9_BUGNE|nr:IMPDH1 [Bugula neritina]
MSADMTVQDALTLKAQHGFSGFPVTSNGEIGVKLVGLVTGRDFDFLQADQYDTAITEVVSLPSEATPSAVVASACPSSL